MDNCPRRSDNCLFCDYGHTPKFEEKVANYDHQKHPGDCCLAPCGYGIPCTRIKGHKGAHEVKRVLDDSCVCKFLESNMKYESKESAKQIITSVKNGGSVNGKGNTDGRKVVCRKL